MWNVGKQEQGYAILMPSQWKMIQHYEYKSTQQREESCHWKFDMQLMNSINLLEPI